MFKENFNVSYCLGNQYSVPVSMSRLELIAAALSVKVSPLLRQELEISINKEHFWTDSKINLG